MQPEKVISLEQGSGISAAGSVPCEAEFFQDHFPDFPVLPGVLMLEILKKCAETYMGSAVSRRCAFRVKEVKTVRFSNFLKPGDPWECRLDLLSFENDTWDWRGKLLSNGKVVCTAQFQLQSF